MCLWAAHRDRRQPRNLQSLRPLLRRVARRARRTVTRYAVVGGGMLGLTLALHLADEGHEVEILEASDRIGGLAAGWTLGDTSWDRFYHVTLESDTNTRAILDRLGIVPISASAETGVFAEGKLYPITTNIDFLRFPMLSLADKFRFGLTILRGAYARDGEAFEQIPVETWLTRWSGKRTFERFWLPLLRSKLGDAYRDTSAAFIWATIQRLYAARSERGNQERFGYIPGGYVRVLAALSDHLTSGGVAIRTGIRVDSVGTSGDAIEIKLDSGQTETYDRAIVTAAGPLASRICVDLPDQERQALADLPYLGVVCASVLLRRQLSPYYVTNLVDPAPFTGVIEMSNLVDPAELNGNHLVYLPKYVRPDDPLFDQDDETIRREFIDGLTAIHPDLTGADIVAFQIARARYVMAIPTISYSKRIPPFSTSNPNLFLVNSAQIVNGTLNVNETVGLANRAAADIL
ncbi:MAG: NAD(P)/FAD-dependent oxidoreductase [Acidimicrobiia bacterium]|nr:NAD(P)/FAD-dependent oxidoreductase [Acidimicrobiia bacterium]